MLKQMILVVGLLALGACSPPDREDTGGGGGPGDTADAASPSVFPDARPIEGRADARPYVPPPDSAVIGGGDGLCASELDCPAPNDCCFIFLEPPGACLPGTLDPILGCFPDF